MLRRIRSTFTGLYTLDEVSNKHFIYYFHFYTLNFRKEANTSFFKKLVCILLLYCYFIVIIKGPEGEQTVKMALQDPEKFVLKPQREGGGK